MPRFYGFDGSTGMDLRPVGQLEAEDAARRERERRRHPMPVTTRIRLVSQPPEGLLPLSLFDRVGLADRKSLYPRSMETVPPDLAGLYVDYMTRVAMGTPVRVAFHVPLFGCAAGRTGRIRGVPAVPCDGFLSRVGACSVPAA